MGDYQPVTDCRLVQHDDVEVAENGGENLPSQGSSWLSLIVGVGGDILASIVFWYAFLFLYLPDAWYYGLWALLAFSMVLWRFAWLTRDSVRPASLPYTCGYATVNGKELFLVATIHISPRAPKDVETVINNMHPDIAMIELDEERLDRMRDVDPELEARQPRKEDLQPITLVAKGREPMKLFTQRTLWNAEFAGSVFAGNVLFDADNAYGLEPFCEQSRDHIVLVLRGGPNGDFAPFALKAHNAARSGAKAVLVMNHNDTLPPNRIGGSTLVGDLRVALRTWSCGFPPIPLLLLPLSASEALGLPGQLAQQFLRLQGPHQSQNSPLSGPHRSLADESDELARFGGQHQRSEDDLQVRASFEVLPDDYPRRTLRRRLCQACALLFSGIGVLYGVIQLFAVEVGAEFLAAEVAATARGIPCTCIDVDLNRFWSRLGGALVPTPCNLLHSLLAWLAFPRVMLRVLLPPRGHVDVLGSMLLHAASFPLRTWAAFLMAGLCASLVTSRGLELLGLGAERAAERAGAVAPEDRDAVQEWFMLGLEMYMLPQIYDAVAASRDDAMYRSVVAKSREHQARRLVVVVGAGHANGILQRAQTYGF